MLRNLDCEEKVNSLAELLAARRPLFDLSLEQLEEISGKQNLPLKLSGEIENKFDEFVKRECDLEAEEVSGEEIYKALMALIWEQNDLVLEKYLKLKLDAGLDEILTACVEFVQKLKLNKAVFRLKKEVAIKMLKRNPPKKILQHLGYNNVEELLEHEQLEEVYGALRFAEGDEWLAKFNLQYRNLKPTDFTNGEIKVVKMPLKWAGLTKKFIEKKRHNITHLKELGVVLVLETEDENLRHGIVLKALPLIVHYFYEIHLYSTFFKLKVRVTKSANFGKLIAETILADPELDIKLGGRRIHWRVIQRYFGKLEDANKHKEIFEPHLQPEDLHWDRAEEALGNAIPELMIWEDLDYVGRLYEDRPLSLNFMDLTLSFANKCRYGDHLFYHFRESLWNEIFARYMGQKALEKELLTKLNNALVAPERIKVRK